MPRRETKTGAPGIEPATMSVPAMDRPSVVFAWFLDGIKVEGPDDESVYFICDSCSERVVEIEHGDSLRVLFNTVLAHTC